LVSALIPVPKTVGRYSGIRRDVCAVRRAYGCPKANRHRSANRAGRPIVLSNTAIGGVCGALGAGVLRGANKSDAKQARRNGRKRARERSDGAWNPGRIHADQQAGAAAHRNGRSIRNRDAMIARIIPIRVDSAGFHIGPRAPPPSRYLQKDKLNSRFCKF